MRNFIHRAKKYRTLIENFGYLSALQGFNMLVPLITYPYLIRVLQPESYGKVAFAQGVAAYYSVLINFGFQSSAPRDISANRDDRAKLSKIVSSIFTAKLILWSISAASLFILARLVPMLASDPWLFLIAFGNTATVLLFPDWYFQGIEKMRRITFIQFGIRLATMVGIFALIGRSSDYLLFASINSVGALAGGLVGMAAMWRDGVRISLQPWHAVREAMARSAPLFYSNIFASLADKGGTLVVGAALGPTELAYYNLAEKLTNLASTIYYNVGRVLYPNLARSRDKAFSRKMARLVMFAGAIGTIVTLVGAPIVVPIFAGSRLEPAVPLLQLFSPYLVFAAVGPLLANILLIENRHESFLPNSVLGGVVYVGALASLWATGTLTAATVVLTFVLAIVVRIGHRLYEIRKYGLMDWLRAPAARRPVGIP